MPEPRPELLTCGNARPFRTLRPIRARKADTGQERACSAACSNNGRQAVAVTADRCSSQYPQLRSGGGGTARARLSSPPERPDATWPTSHHGRHRPRHPRLRRPSVPSRRSRPRARARPFPRAWSAAPGGGVAGDPASQLPHRPLGVILLPRVESKIAFAERFLVNCPIAKNVTVGLD